MLLYDGVTHNTEGVRSLHRRSDLVVMVCMLARYVDPTGGGSALVSHNEAIAARRSAGHAC